DVLEEAVAHLGNYLFHELTTPLGLRLDYLRHRDSIHNGSGPAPEVLAAPLRSFGTYAVWFPRGLLLRLAGRRACQRLIQSWLATGKEEITAEALTHIRAFLEKSTHHPDLQPDALARLIQESSPAGTLSNHG